jgi:MFS family permease
MLLIAGVLAKGGIRMTIFIGILAWPLRYAIFAIGQPTWLVIASQTLHGVCYSFFFVGGMIAVERLSHKDIRASAQGLLVFATNGLGMLVGNYLAGKVSDFYKVGDLHQWSMIFLVPIAVTVISGIAFILLWNERKFQEDSAAIEQQDAPAEQPLA